MDSDVAQTVCWFGALLLMVMPSCCKVLPRLRHVDLSFNRLRLAGLLSLLVPGGLLTD